MKKNLSRMIRNALAALGALFLAAGSAWAGPPLICHAFDIGNAKSLPWVSHGWSLNGEESYDVKNLPDDTIAILETSSPTPLVHMETLRRATLYARKDPTAAKQLLLKLTARAEASANSAQPEALAIFDAGYLAEAYKQWLGEGAKNPANGMDGYTLVKRAIQLRRGDAQMEFAAALIALSGPSAEQQAHAAKALAGAKSDQLLAQNLNSHFLGQSQTMAEMISHGSETKAAKQ
jgi:hypothetical protein